MYKRILFSKQEKKSVIKGGQTVVTIKDIAREANVSCTTVSNVINKNYSRVSMKTIERIERIIEEKNYNQNLIATSLVKKTSKLIAYISTSPLQTSFNMFFMSSLEISLRKYGYALMIHSITDDSGFSNFLNNWNIGGLVILGKLNANSYALLAGLKIPVVTLDSYFYPENVYCIRTDDYNAGYDATSYLINNGHRNIAFIAFSRKGYTDTKRFEGYCNALKNHGIPFNEDYTYFTAENQSNSGFDIITKPNIVNNCTAGFATEDNLAAEVIASLASVGKKVPDDFSIVGFDDSPICKLTVPKITTMHQDNKYKGVIIAEYLNKLLNNESVDKVTMLPQIYLVERESVKSIK